LIRATVRVRVRFAGVPSHLFRAIIIIVPVTMKNLLSLCLPLLAAGSPVIIDTIHKDAAPVVTSLNGKDIPNSYMVIFKKHVTERAAQDHHLWVQDLHSNTESVKMELRKRSMSLQDTVFEGLKHTYHIPGSLLGYSGHFDEDVIDQVRRHPDVSRYPLKHLLSTFYPGSAITT
jgi:cerevisin